MQLLGELGDVQRRLDRLREGLEALLDDEGDWAQPIKPGAALVSM